MKKLLLTLLLCGILIPVSAQKFCYIDTDYILENLPSYNQAQNTLKSQTQQWNTEIQNRQEALDKRQVDFLNEKVLLTEEQIKTEQAAIDTEIKDIKDLQEKRYGQNGDLIKLRRSLVKPIQDQIYIAVDEIAKKKNYSFVFDKGSNLIMVYTDPKFDISRDVLLQLNPDAVVKEPEKPSPKPSGNKNQQQQPPKSKANTTKPDARGQQPTKPNNNVDRSQIKK